MQIQGRSDESKVRKRLRKIADLPLRLRIVFYMWSYPQCTGERHRAHRVRESPNGPVGTQSLASSSEFAFSGKLGSVFPSLHCRSCSVAIGTAVEFMAFSDPDVVASTTKSTPFICNLL